jgi:hypothetical protein
MIKINILASRRNIFATPPPKVGKKWEIAGKKWENTATEVRRGRDSSAMEPRYYRHAGAI